MKDWANQYVQKLSIRQINATQYIMKSNDNAQVARSEMIKTHDCEEECMRKAPRTHTWDALQNVISPQASADTVPLLFSPGFPRKIHQSPIFFLLDPFPAYLAMEYPLTWMLSATPCSRSPPSEEKPQISPFFSLFVSSSASHPRLHCSSCQQGWSFWPLAWPVACPCSWFPGRREKGPPTYSRCCPAPLMLYKKTKIPCSPNGVYTY